MAVYKDELVHCLFQTVRVLADTIGLKESFTPAHQSNVANIARTIGQIMCLDRDIVDGVRMGATLHDFGILRIPSGILNKPSKLTEEEFEIMKQHPVHGFNMLKGIDFPWPVGRMILQHHERLDGSGYPGGISGSEIILEARIIAVADIVDSMTSDRPYRKALPVEEALDELKQGRGTKYDPDVIDACVELYTNQQHRLEPEYYGR
ncbi:MAG: HD-GYP domain-containing protein [Alphaproteobacteria bacterium]|nr:HD-GYP domain-containing protein [Alphaproteobacteria bacterium]